jgi:hypothetical protein
MSLSAAVQKLQFFPTVNGGDSAAWLTSQLIANEKQMIGM